MTQEPTPKVSGIPADGITAASAIPSLAQNPARPKSWLAICVLLGFALGIAVGFLSPRLWRGADVQEGVALVPYKGQADHTTEVQVYYKVPFATPPLLTFPDASQGAQIEVVEQKPDSFKVRAFVRGVDLKVKWRAEGVPAVSK
jgi:hypothetical protein